MKKTIEEFIEVLKIIRQDIRKKRNSAYFIECENLKEKNKKLKKELKLQRKINCYLVCERKIKNECSNERVWFRAF